MQPTDAYELATAGLEDFGRELRSAFKAALDKTSVTLHDIPFRVKRRESAVIKLLSTGRAPDDFLSLHDLLGMRVITLFEDDLDIVTKVINEILDVDKTSDKIETHASDAFGYRSLHFVGTLSEARAGMIEYSRYAGMRVEVQARTHLQHGWAEIEHDLGYKPERPLDEKLRRRFSRLAALMEIADSEFVSLRGAVIGGIPAAGEIAKVPTAQLSVANLIAHIRESKDLRTLDRRVSTVLSDNVLPEGKNYRAFAGHLLDLCLAAGWTDLAQLRAAESEAASNAVQWATSLTEQERLAVEASGHGLRPGFSIGIAARRASVAKA